MTRGTQYLHHCKVHTNFGCVHIGARACTLRDMRIKFYGLIKGDSWTTNMQVT